MNSAFEMVAITPSVVLRHLVSPRRLIPRKRVSVRLLFSIATTFVFSASASDTSLFGRSVVNDQGKTIGAFYKNESSLSPFLQRFDYGWVIDAGSTGSRINVFRWKKRIVHLATPGVISGTPWSFPEEIGFMRVTPGISSFTRAPGDAQASIRPLLKFAEVLLRNITPEVEFTEVATYIGATGGLRSLPEDKLHSLLQSIRELLRSSVFSGPISDVRVLSGEEEGAFAWLSVNENQLGSARDWAGDTYGVLDLGGESAQIAFIPHVSSVKAGFFPMSFGSFKDHFHVFTHSFLGFGMEVAWQKVGTLLLRDNNMSDEFASDDGVTINHPCLPFGVSWHVDTNDFGVSCHHVPQRTTGKILFRGTHNFDACVALARRLLPKDVPCDFGKECSFHGQYQPSVKRTRFVTIGGFHWAFTREMKLPDGVSMEHVMLRLRSEFDSLPLPNNTFRSPKSWGEIWAVVILTHGLGFEFGNDPLLWNSMPRNTSWARGWMINAVNHFSWYSLGQQTCTPPPPPTPSLHSHVRGIFFAVAIVVVLCAASFVLGLWANGSRHQLHGGVDRKVACIEAKPLASPFLRANGDCAAAARTL